MHHVEYGVILDPRAIRIARNAHGDAVATIGEAQIVIAHPVIFYQTLDGVRNRSRNAVHAQRAKVTCINAPERIE